VLCDWCLHSSYAQIFIGNAVDQRPLSACEICFVIANCARVVRLVSAFIIQTNIRRKGSFSKDSFPPTIYVLSSQIVQVVCDWCLQSSYRQIFIGNAVFQKTLFCLQCMFCHRKLCRCVATNVYMCVSRTYIPYRIVHSCVSHKRALYIPKRVPCMFEWCAYISLFCSRMVRGP